MNHSFNIFNACSAILFFIHISDRINDRGQFDRFSNVFFFTFNIHRNLKKKNYLLENSYDM